MWIKTSILTVLGSQCTYNTSKKYILSFWYD